MRQDNDPRNIHRRDGRDEQARTVQSIVANTRVWRPANPKLGQTRTVWNNYLQRYVEIR